MESTEAIKGRVEDISLQEENDIVNKGKQVVLLPTGAGKSLCFMVPGLLLENPTLIIYPLLALMSDQLRRIEEKGLKVAIFRGQQSQEEREENFKKLDSGAKFILANPEILNSEKILQRLKKYNIIHTAIDEAHCVSEWGDSFRPSYLELGRIIQFLEIPVVTAFTATASAPVLKRITEILFNGERP
ncbi:MAG: DEAD/DEAH box helicase, partial [Spirochaetaceae bacterium]|nr:DEAD/DEAH box helicase [Spirochaetaceae bacterium]